MGWTDVEGLNVTLFRRPRSMSSARINSLPGVRFGYGEKWDGTEPVLPEMDESRPISSEPGVETAFFVR
jgi:hypothetical protein